jgi:hypothetical protein
MALLLNPITLNKETNLMAKKITQKINVEYLQEDLIELLLKDIRQDGYTFEDKNASVSINEQGTAAVEVSSAVVPSIGSDDTLKKSNQSLLKQLTAQDVKIAELMEQLEAAKAARPMAKTKPTTDPFTEANSLQAVMFEGLEAKNKDILTKQASSKFAPKTTSTTQGVASASKTPANMAVARMETNADTAREVGEEGIPLINTMEETDFPSPSNQQTKDNPFGKPKATTPTRKYIGEANKGHDFKGGWYEPDAKITPEPTVEFAYMHTRMAFREAVGRRDVTGHNFPKLSEDEFYECYVKFVEMDKDERMKFIVKYAENEAYTDANVMAIEAEEEFYRNENAEKKKARFEAEQAQAKIDSDNITAAREAKEAWDLKHGVIDQSTPEGRIAYREASQAKALKERLLFEERARNGLDPVTGEAYDEEPKPKKAHNPFLAK